MCGILLVQSQSHIPLEHHLAALRLLEPRGPDFSVHQYHNGIFIGQTVLHITGSADAYQTRGTSFVAYNGEIYNYRDFGSYSNDIELIRQTVPHDISRFKQMEGMWAWAWTDFDRVLYATDPQGEKALYRYQDDDILIVSSEITPILHYRSVGLDVKPYTTKHWPIVKSTPWRGIDRVDSGVMFDCRGSVQEIDSIFDWVKPVDYSDLESASEEFDALFSRVLADMTPSVPYGCAFSGGVDSASIVAALDPGHLYAVNVLDKEQVALDAQQYLPYEKQNRVVQIDVNESTWAVAFQASMRRSQLPAQSWSFVGQELIAWQCRERVLFTGVGADELFGGYDLYDTLSYTVNGSTSPYSRFQDDTELASIWQRCLVANSQDPRAATLMMDYIINCGAVDLRGVDMITSAHGIEPRSPFVHPAVIKFALGLPWQYRVSMISKPVVKAFLHRRWPLYPIAPKQGFAGHCNDSYSYLGIDIKRHQDRHQDWKNILKATYQSIVL